MILPPSLLVNRANAASYYFLLCLPTSMGNLYWSFFVKRRVEQIQADFYRFQPVADSIKDLVHNIFSYASENTTEQEWAIQTATSLFSIKYSDTPKVSSFLFPVRRTISWRLIPSFHFNSNVKSGCSF